MKNSSLMPIFSRLPVSFTHGQGMWLFDSNNNRYLDALSGMGVVSLGHSHPAIIEAITTQAKRLIHTSNTFVIDEQEKLSDELTQYAGMDKAIFINSGAEASEVAIKIARLYGHRKEIKIPEMITFKGGFHGRTFGSLSASANIALQKGFEPILEGFNYLTYNEIAEVEKVVKENPNICSIMVEPILGQGGVVLPDDNFLIQLRRIANENNLLFILDEIQTGMSRTGKNFAYQFYPIQPDVLTTAKALGNGLPIAACMATNEIAELMVSGKHGTTFGGNPLCCHVARTVLKVYEEEGLTAHAGEMGDYLLQSLHHNLDNAEGVVEIRGKGLMIGIELDQPCNKLYKYGLDVGLLFNIATDKVVRLLPPYILNKEEADLIVERLTSAIKQFYMHSATQVVGK